MANPTPAQEEKLDIKSILPVFVIVLIDLLGLTIIIPLLPLYSASYGASEFMIGALGAAYPIMQFVGAPILGRLSDKYGRRPILLISQVGTFLGFILLGFSTSLWMLFLSRIIDGISGANISTAQAVITDRTTEKTRTQGLGLIGAAFGLGFIVGPIIAFVTLAVSNQNYSLVAFVAAGFSFLSILLTYFWLEESHPPEKRGQGNSRASYGIKAMLDALKQPYIGFLLILMFAQQFAFGGFEQLISLFTLTRLGMNASDNSMLFVFIGVIVVIVQGGMVGKWSRRYGDKWLIFMGLSVMGLGLILASTTPHVPVNWYSRAELQEELTHSDADNHNLPGETPPVEDLKVPLPDEANKGWFGLVWLVISMIPIAIAGGVLMPAVNSLLTKYVPPAEVGGTLGLSAAFMSGANAVSPLILGAIFQGINSTAPFLIGGVILWILWVLARRTLK